MTDLRNVPLADDVEWLQLKYAMNAALPVSAPVAVTSPHSRLNAKAVHILAFVFGWTGDFRKPSYASKRGLAEYGDKCRAVEQALISKARSGDKTLRREILCREPNMGAATIDVIERFLEWHGLGLPRDNHYDKVCAF